MKFSARFSEGEKTRSRSVELTSGAGEGERTSVALDGVEAAYDVVPCPGGGYSVIAPDGLHAEATVHHEPDGVLRVYVAGKVFRLEFLDDLTAQALAATGVHKGKKKGDLKAAIPGRVLRISVAPGDAVALGQSLLVLEAMKMENDVRSNREGVVKSIEVKPGEAVNAGMVLIRFEV